MNHSSLEPARDQRVNRSALPGLALFSHPPQAEAFEQHSPAAGGGDGSGWRATPFSGEGTEQHHRLVVDEEN